MEVLHGIYGDTIQMSQLRDGIYRMRVSGNLFQLRTNNRLLSIRLGDKEGDDLPCSYSYLLSKIRYPRQDGVLSIKRITLGLVHHINLHRINELCTLTDNRCLNRILDRNYKVSTQIPIHDGVQVVQYASSPVFTGLSNNRVDIPSYDEDYISEDDSLKFTGLQSNIHIHPPDCEDESDDESDGDESDNTILYLESDTKARNLVFQLLDEDGHEIVYTIKLIVSSYKYYWSSYDICVDNSVVLECDVYIR